MQHQHDGWGATRIDPTAARYSHLSSALSCDRAGHVSTGDIAPQRCWAIWAATSLARHCRPETHSHRSSAAPESLPWGFPSTPTYSSPNSRRADTAGCAGGRGSADRTTKIRNVRCQTSTSTACSRHDPMHQPLASSSSGRGADLRARTQGSPDPRAISGVESWTERVGSRLALT